MTWRDRLDGWVGEGRGALLAALLALVAALPGALVLPPLDRDEARFAQATAQMLESGDFISIRFQETPRNKKPVGIHWLQAAAVAVLSSVEARQIWAYRVPSLLGAMLAAAACVWGAEAFLPTRPALAAGALLAGGLLFSSEAGIAATDAVLTGAVALMMAAAARVYIAERGGAPAGRRSRLLLWASLILGVMVKGPIAPMILLLSLLALAMWDGKARWIAGLGWGWGLIALAAVAGPWALAITVASDGAYWSGAVGQDLAAKLAGGQEGHGAPPGFHALLSPITLFPAWLFAPAAVLAAFRHRHDPGARFALCWLIPAWLLFEFTPTKLVHYTLPLFPAIAWLIGLALTEPIGPRAARIGITVGALAAAVLAAVGFVAMARLGDFGGLPYAVAGAVLFLASAGFGGWLLLRGALTGAAAAALVPAVAAHAIVAALFLPSLRPLWLSPRAAAAVSARGLNPTSGVTPGPVTIAGFAEPSLVFLLGTDTRQGSAEEAAEAVSEGRPAIVEGREDAAFQTALARLRARASHAGQGAGLDYSTGRPDLLRIYRPAVPQPHPETPAP